MSFIPARAIIIAGKPLSHEAIPITALAVGKDLANLRKTFAASFLYGKESNIPVVPCVLPSHGSEQNAAKGRPPSSFIVFADSSTRFESSQCPV